MSNAVVSNLSLKDLLLAVSACLCRLVKHDIASVVLYDEKTDQLRVHALDTPIPGTALSEGSVLPLEGTPPGLAIRTRSTVMRERIDLAEFNSPLMRIAYENGLRCGCSVPLISHGRVLGTINVGSLHEAAFTKEDAELLEQIAGQVAIAVENTLNFERATRERERSRLLLEINNAVVSHLDLKELVKAISASLRDIMPHDSAGIALYEPELNQLREYTNVSYTDLNAFRVGETIPIEGTPAGQVFLTGRPMLIKRPNADEYPADRYSQHPVEGSPKSACLALLVSHGRKLGIAGVSSTQVEKFTDEDLELFSQIATQIALAVENALNFEREAKERERAQILLEINNAIATSLDLRDLLREISECLRKYFKHDFAGMALYDEQSGQLRVHALDSSQASESHVEEGFLIPLEETPAGKSYTSRQTVLIRRLDAEEFPSPVVERAIAAGFKSSCNAPLIAHDITLGSVVVVS